MALFMLPEAAQSVNLEKASPTLGSLQTTTAQTWWAWRQTRRYWANWWRSRLLRWDNSWTNIPAFGHWWCRVGSSASISTSSPSRWAEELFPWRRSGCRRGASHGRLCSLSPADGPASLGLSVLRGLQGSFPCRPDPHHAPSAGDPESSLAARRLPVLQADHLWSFYPGLSHIYAGTTSLPVGKLTNARLIKLPKVKMSKHLVLISFSPSCSAENIHRTREAVHGFYQQTESEMQNANKRGRVWTIMRQRLFPPRQRWFLSKSNIFKVSYHSFVWLWEEFRRGFLHQSTMKCLQHVQMKECTRRCENLFVKQCQQQGSSALLKQPCAWCLT